ncbi:hypothetical protein CVT26_009307 [Gymnopilus dilepis]|uniref:nicotinamidase n=1 Tax=Gymnopilus dilepis TaxID=231916 RepID=A0A409YAC6_9AGAR|nr:hypothetical protein CVT26_009307 [Gymnopilus dilepis]
MASSHCILDVGTAVGQLALEMAEQNGKDVKFGFVPALIVIDMQNDFVTGSLAVPGGETIVDNINSLIDLPFKVRVATRDYHPDKHVSFADTHKQDVFSKKIIYHPEDTEKKHGIDQVLWPVHCVADTPGADFVPGLNTSRFDIVILKGIYPDIESYSGFRDVWGRRETDLPGFLREKGITDVYFVGLAGDFCVKFTALDAVDYGFRTWVVTDAVKSIASDDAHFTEMESKGIKFLNTEDVQVALRT